MDTNLEKQLMSIGEAAKYLGVSIDTLRRWEVRGRVRPSRSPGGHRYYTKDDLEQLFNKKYTRDEYSGTFKKAGVPENVPEVKLEVEEITSPAAPNLNYPSQTGLSPVEAIIPQPDEIIPEVFPKEAEVEKPPIASAGSEPSREADSTSILEPTPTPQNQPTINTVQTPVNSMNQQRDRLNDILGAEKEAKLTKGELFSIIGIIVFVTIDVILFLTWYKSTNIVVPIP